MHNTHMAYMERGTDLGAAVATLGQVDIICPPGSVLSADGKGCDIIGLPVPTTPGPVPVACDRWDLDAATYRIASGDTYVGLAATYLNDGGRWQEIWSLNKAQHPNPGKIIVGDVINMPAEAVDNSDCAKGPAEVIKKVFPFVLVGVLALGGGYVIYRIAKPRRRG